MNFYTKLSGYIKNSLYKFLVVMQFTLILLFIGIMHLSAKTYGQQLTLNKNGISIKQVFRAIKSQTGYDVLWQSEKFDTNKKIDAHFYNTPLSNVIKECFKDHSFNFEIQDQSIVIKNLYIKSIFVASDSAVYHGKITDNNGRPMSGATIKVIGNTKSTFSNNKGDFAVYAPLKGTIEISFVGFISKRVTLNGLNPNNAITVILLPGENNLGEVNVVSNGYQDIPKERATGSFEVITKEQLQHSTDPNLIKRLEGITTSMNFNNNLTPTNSANTNAVTLSGQASESPLAKLTIRGKNTLNSTQFNGDNPSGQVLVVIDGVASPYSIDYVNPNDVETITVLKDAAAASIWGSRAANGVIVITTKKGSYDKPVNVSFNGNLNITDKPDLFYKKIMSTSDYIDAQAYLFNASNTSIPVATVTRPQAFFSPVAEILGQKKNGLITSSQSNLQLDALRGNDVRRDFDKYVLRDASTQSYSLSIDGGSKKVAYRISGGYDRTINNTIGSGNNRWVLGYNTSFKPVKNLEINANITYSVNTTENQAAQDAIKAIITPPFFPYTRLVDNDGNPVVVPYKYRQAFKSILNSTYGSKIQDLGYSPLQNINEGYFNTSSKNLNFLINGNYKITNLFSASIAYNYNKGNNLQESLNSENSFYARDLITYFTTTDGTQQIPFGSIYRPSTVNSEYQSARGQLNFNKIWKKQHELNMIAGMEVTQNYSLSKSYQYYGYDENTLTSNNQLNYTTNLTTLYRDQSIGLPFSKIPYTQSNFTDYKIRTLSYYINGAYTYNNRYTVSASGRKDLSSEFGIGTNTKGTPFYSFGGSWNIANEDFYKISWLPQLKLRTTFGYNGNVNPQTSGNALIAYSSGVQDNNLLSATTSTSNVTNNNLRPEKTAVLNFGLDFGLRNSGFSGSFEYYRKKTTDLIASNAIDPSTGFGTLAYNTASLFGQGIDFTLTTKNLQSGSFSWNSNLLFSYNRVKVEQLFTPSAQTAQDVISGSPGYNVGYDLTRIFAFRWAGLDHATGSPMGFQNDGTPIIVKDATSFLAVGLQPINSAKFFGSAVPVYYGSLRNTFKYKRFALSANLLYKLGYYTRRPFSDMVNYSSLFSRTFNNAVQGAEYAQRWQKPGDEAFTNVPSLLYPADQYRDLFYQFSDINVIKGDHVRLQEVNFSYFFGKKSFLNNARIYANVSNLGIIWRANKLHLDPDIFDLPNPRSYSVGFSANF